MYSDLLKKSCIQIKRLRGSCYGATGLEYGLFAAGVGAVIFATIGLLGSNSNTVLGRYGAKTHEIQDKLSAGNIVNVLSLTLGDIPGITGSVTWGTTTQPVAGWVGARPLELGKLEFFAAGTKPPSGANVVIEMDGQAGESDSMTKDYSYIPPNTNVAIDIESALRPAPGTKIDKDGLDVIWNGQKVSTIRATSKGNWVVDQIMVNTSDGDGSGQLTIASSDNGTSADDGVGMLISNVTVSTQ